MGQTESAVKPANLLKADEWRFEYREKSSPHTSNLELLTYGTYRIAPRAASTELFHRREEAIVYCLGGVPKPSKLMINRFGSRTTIRSTFPLPRHTAS